MFLKEKLDGPIKGCRVAYGIKLRDKIEPKDTTSPTVSIEAVTLTAPIDALGGRVVVVVDIPGSYLRAEMEDKVHVVFRGTLSELVVASEPELYQPFVSYTMGQAVLYV